jgi:polysaccharide deacetylase family protein (PEP-CTERM system associated)
VVLEPVIDRRAWTRKANALTIDFEDWFQGLEIPHRHWHRYERRIEHTGRKLLAVLADTNTRGTFFVLGDVAARHPGLVREIATAGHEVGTHGFSHTLVYRQQPDTFREETKRALHTLQDLTGRNILGHRAPFFSITNESLWALEILGDLGIQYDSSIFPVTNYRYGIPNAPRWPHVIRTTDHTLIEFPISTWRVLGHNVPIGGGAYFRLYPYRLTQHAFRAINKLGYPFTFYLHPWELDPLHPKIPLPRRISVTHYWNLERTEGRFRRLLADFQFAPMKEVLGIDGQH